MERQKHPTMLFVVLAMCFCVEPIFAVSTFNYKDDFTRRIKDWLKDLPSE